MNPAHDSIHGMLVSAGLPVDFLDTLIHESDWSMVIKLHALFEAVLANLLIRKLGGSALDDVIAHLDFNNTKSGKVAFARALGLLETREVAFLRGLSELRNQLVHDARNVSFNFQNHVARFSEAQRKKFKSEFGGSLCITKAGEERYAKYLQENPAYVVLFAAYHCLFLLHFNVEEQKRKLLVEALMKEASK